MRKGLFCLLAALLLLSLFSVAAAEEDNLIVNGDFSQVENGLPVGWYTYAYFSDAGITHFSCEDGTAQIYNLDFNDARFCQAVPVEPGAYYQITCRVKAEAYDIVGEGANISIDNTLSKSNTARETDGEWVNLTLTGQAGPDQTEVVVLLRVGFYGAESRVRAWFDDVRMVKLDGAPADAQAVSFATLAPADNDDGGQSDSFFEEEAASGYETHNELILLAAVLFVFLLGAVYTQQFRRAHGELRARSARGILAVAMLFALILRCAIALSVRGYAVDINCFEAWAYRMLHTGPLEFYSDPNYFCDYPPVYLLLLWPMEALRTAFGIAYDSNAHWLMIKLVPILFDLAGAAYLYANAKQSAGERVALVLACLYAFNPIAILDSAAWGQVDSVFTLMLAVAAVSLVRGRYPVALPVFALAVLTKPQALLFAPLGLIFVVAALVRARDYKACLRALVGLAGALVLFLLTGCVFSGGQNPVVWLWNLYTNTVSGYRYVTINAMNLYELFSLNWASLAAHPAATAVAFALFVAAYLFSFFLALRSKASKHLFLITASLIALLFVFGPMMHERYAFPALLLMLMAYAACRDKRILCAFTLLTAGLFINVSMILQDGLYEVSRIITGAERIYPCIAALLNLAGALCLAWTAFDVTVRGREKPFAVETLPDPHKERLLAPANYKLNLKRLDYLLIAGVTVVYSVLAFTNLGSTKAPQTAWTSSAPGETVTIDLGTEQTFHMTYYGGVSTSTFTVELSSDGVTWTEPHEAQFSQGVCFRWLWYQPGEMSDSGKFTPLQSGYPMQNARYVRLRAERVGLTLHEVAFLDENGAVLPISGISRDGAAEEFATDFTLLTDEQDTVPPYPSYYNGTYFDEIYHARTAYEHLNGTSAYEWTHPPLGKVLMMIGIKLFGMTPFGWRFMGAVMGVLMLPVMYLLAKQLTKRTDLSCIAMALLALDSMHFTQTRIATIDSYVVFFIMVMYLFMIRYVQMSFFREPLWKTLVPLGLSGLFMGFAWASKWTGIYASVGLAFLFFLTVYWRAREYFCAEDREKVRGFARKLAITLGCCVVFFVAVPLVIYYCSYYWQMLPSGGLTVQKVLDLQITMFNYHNDLEATHSFASPWYEWPLIVRPMWYYSGADFMPANMVSSISCMGNPAVWWTGLAALIICLWRLAAERKVNQGMFIVAVGFASQYLPWVLISRCTFIYHYFASVPFLILAIVFVLERIRARDARTFKGASIFLVAAAAVLFAMFYPLESGMPVARSYAMLLRWFNWYNF